MSDNIRSQPKMSKCEKTGMVIWFTGLSGTGKTTYAKKLAARLYKEGIETEFLDSDELRALADDLSYSYEDRVKNVKRIALISSYLEKHGVCVIVACIAPFYCTRDFIRKVIKNYTQVYLKAEKPALKERKKIYKLAEEGKINNVIGHDLPYEEPRRPDIVIETGGGSVDDGVDKIIKLLKSRGFVQRL